MSKPIYVLGTGLSHDGSSCLLKDGEIIVAIEKERLTRIKHDGGNDYLTAEYCLKAAGIGINDLSLVVQCANFEKEEIRKDHYRGNRIFPAGCQVPFVTISHHLAHAWSAAGSSAFNEGNILVLDGCGSFYHQCDDLEAAFIPEGIDSSAGLYAEKDSFYFFNGRSMTPLYKDFSVIQHRMQNEHVRLPATRHSIGGLYAMAAHYCFGSYDDAGKLMGLAPYGSKQVYQDSFFILENGRVHIDEAVIQKHFTLPADKHLRPFNDHFRYYAGIASRVQQEAEKAILYVVNHRMQMHPHANLGYAGGVALNAVTNSKILMEPGINQFHIEPAAGDNGLATGCAWYGWIEHLQKEKKTKRCNTLLGKMYTDEEIDQAVHALSKEPGKASFSCIKDGDHFNRAASLLHQGKTIGWFQLGSEFGPRALGRRSILADPGINGISAHINNTIKLREDFRPFAPAVLHEDKNTYFQYGHESPFMILTDMIREEWRDRMPGVVHVDGSCRVQTVSEPGEPFYQLLKAWKALSGISVLLNTSFNRKGMPIVETPEEAILFFLDSNLDALVIHDYVFIKQHNDQIPEIAISI